MDLDIDKVVKKYDETLMQLNKQLILLSVLSEEQGKEIESLKEELEQLKNK